MKSSVVVAGAAGKFSTTLLEGVTGKAVKLAVFAVEPVYARRTSFSVGTRNWFNTANRITLSSPFSLPLCSPLRIQV